MSAPQAAAQAAETGAAEAAKKGFFRRHGGTIGTLGAFVVGPMLLDRLINGSPETQQRKAFQVQRELEMQAAKEQLAASQGGGYEGLIAGEAPQSLADISEEEELINRLRGYARARNDNRYYQNAGSRELMDLIGSDSARLRQLQAGAAIDPGYMISHFT